MGNRKVKNKNSRSSKPIQAELALLEVFWHVARDNFHDYFASRAEVHHLNVVTALNKPDAESDKVYA
jgi:hypothetical protein